jgi:hypothetical protein
MAQEVAQFSLLLFSLLLFFFHLLAIFSSDEVINILDIIDSKKMIQSLDARQDKIQGEILTNF